jgi:hypothetical protein
MNSRQGKRSIWPVIGCTLLVWGVTTVLSVYGMWRDPWIGEQGSGEHPLLVLGLPLWFGLIGASALGAPMPIAALAGAALQFAACLPLGLALRWLLARRSPVDKHPEPPCNEDPQPSSTIRTIP